MERSRPECHQWDEPSTSAQHEYAAVQAAAANVVNCCHHCLLSELHARSVSQAAIQVTARKARVSLQVNINTDMALH